MKVHSIRVKPLVERSARSNYETLYIDVCMNIYDGEATSPAGPWPSVWPATVLLRGLNPSSSLGTPNVDSFAS